MIQPAHAPPDVSEEEILRVIQKLLQLGMIPLVTQIRELLELLLLRGIQLRRNFQIHADVQVADAVALNVLHALASQTEDRARLRARRNLDAGLASQGRNVDCRA